MTFRALAAVPTTQHLQTEHSCETDFELQCDGEIMVNLLPICFEALVDSLHVCAHFLSAHLCFHQVTSSFLQTGGWGIDNYQKSTRSAAIAAYKGPLSGINYQISWATHGTNIDVPYHLC